MGIADDKKLVAVLVAYSARAAKYWSSTTSLFGVQSCMLVLVLVLAEHATVLGRDAKCHPRNILSTEKRSGSSTDAE